MNFSVILTTYNRPNMLEKAILSVLNQTNQNFELLLMDDNSDDKKQIDILNKYKNHEKVVFFKSDVTPQERRKKVRYSVLINEALKIATGELVSYICDDDYFELNKLERMKKWFETNPDKHVLMGNQRCVLLEGAKEVDMPTPIRTQPSQRQDPNCNVDHSSVAHRMSVIEKAGEWIIDPNYWGSADGEFFDKCIAQGFTFYGLGGNYTDTHVYHDGSWTKDAQHQYLGTEREKDVKQA